MSTEKQKEDKYPNFTWGGVFALIVLVIFYYFLFRFVVKI